MFTFFGPAGKVNMDRSSHPSAEVGGAGVEVAVLRVLSGEIFVNYTKPLPVVSNSPA